MSMAEQKSLQALANIKNEVDALAVQVEVVVKSAAIGVAPAQQQLKLLHELITQTLLKLDLVSGEGEVRAQRKAQVLRVERLASQLDKAEQGGSIGDPLAVAPPAPQPSQEETHQAPGEPDLFKAEGGNQSGGAPLSSPTPPSPSAPAQLPFPPPPSSTPTTPPVPPLTAVPPPAAAPVPKVPSAASPAPTVPKSVAPSVSPSIQKSPPRPTTMPGGAAPPPRKAGEDTRKKTAGMMSHALSLNNGLPTVTPPPLQPRLSLASSATAAFVAQQQAPKTNSAPSAAPIVPSASTPLAPTISDRLDGLRVSAAPPPVAHSTSIHDLDAFFGGAPTKAPMAAPTAPTTSPSAHPNFATFETAPVDHPSTTVQPSPVQSPVAVQYPSPSGPKLSFSSPPQAPERKGGPGVATLGTLPAFAPPAARRSSGASEGPPSYKASAASPVTSPQEAPRPQRRSEAAPVLGNLAGFAAVTPPLKPLVKESGPSTGVSPYSPPPSALSSFGAPDLPSPATRSTLSRPASDSSAAPPILPPPSIGVRSSLQATSIEEALWGALSRRESATKPALPVVPPAKSEPARSSSVEAACPANGSSTSVSSPSAVQQPAAAQSSWVAFDADFDPRAFASSSTKTSPSASRRSSYDLPPPPRPAQPLFPELAPAGRSADSTPVADKAPAASLLDDGGEAPPMVNGDAAPAPVSPPPVAASGHPQASEQPLGAGPSGPPAPQLSFAEAFSNPPQPAGSLFAKSAPQQHEGGPAPSSKLAPGLSAPQASWNGVASVAQPSPLQSSPPPAEVTSRTSSQALAWPQAGTQGPTVGQGSLAPVSTAPPSAGPTGVPTQHAPPASAPAGVPGGRPLEGFGEVALQQGGRTPGQPAVRPGWPQQGMGSHGGMGPGGGALQGYGFGGTPQPFAAAPAYGQGFGGVPAVAGPSYPYAYQSQYQAPAPWMQQAGPAGIPYGAHPGGASGQAWPYQQTAGAGAGAGAGGQMGAQQPYGGGGPVSAPTVLQASGLPSQVAPSNGSVGLTGPSGAGWPGSGSSGGGNGAPAILPPWMIQPQQRQQAPSSGQGW